MSSEESKEKCFTFFWKIQNISYCIQKIGECIKSPSFVVDAIDGTKWKLGLYPRGRLERNNIGCFLSREADSKGGETSIKYELAIIGEDGSALACWSDNTTFNKNWGYGPDRFEKRDDVFISRRSSFLRRDTLTFRCKMWKSIGKITEDVLCTAHTLIAVEKISFLWKVKDFYTLESEKKCSYQIKSIKNEAPLMSVDLYITGGLSSEEPIRIEMSRKNESIKYCTFHLSLIDAFGSRVQCNQDEFWFDSVDKTKQFTFHFTKNQLLVNKSMYLPDDALSLHCELDFSKGVVSEEIEEVQYGSIIPGNKTTDQQNMKNEKEVPLSHTLSDNLKSVYDEQVFCDVKLKTNTSTFPAHKIILCASSTVFKSMFSTNMKEKDSDCVNIQDLSDDAVGRMLLYMYTERVEDLSWESATQLYVAADKYYILNLKNICSAYLKENLTQRNACEVLLLADMHADSDLKSTVQDYILKYIKEIANSHEWKLLIENNAKLAAETVCLQYK